jgi:hypothetical protein
MKSRGCIVPQANSLKTLNDDGDLMESRICEHCGQQFFAPTKSEKKDDKYFPLMMIIFPLLAYTFFEMGGWCWLPAILFILTFVNEIREKINRNKRKEGKLVAPDRNCPSCDEASADIDSPLGRQLILNWSDPSKMDPEFIDALSSIVSSAGDAGSAPRKRLIANQPSPPAIEPQRAGVAPSIIPVVGDEAGEVVADR